MKCIIIVCILATICFCSPFKSEECGRPAVTPDTSTNVIGGKDAIPYSWPWQVAVAVYYPKDSPVFHANNEFYFGASLISDQWLVTSAYPVYKHGVASNKAKLGVFDKTRIDEPGEKVIEIEEVHIHPKFNYTLSINDIALLKLKTPVQFTDHVSPICLPATQDEELPDADTAMFLAGWGYTKVGEGGETQTLKQTNVPLVSTEQCKKRNGEATPTQTQFCAGLDEGGRGPCWDGDIGGPLMYQDPITKVWKQIGIASNGNTCALPEDGYPTYTKVSAFLDFIRANVMDL